mgnify:CR=1 FL=1
MSLLDSFTFSGRLAARSHVREQDVAIIGLAVRLPQADNLEAFWQNLRDGVESVRPIAGRRRDDILDYRARLPFYQNGTLIDGGFLDQIDSFDQEFFRLSPGEAALLDPHQRLFLQVAWHALEDAGIAPSSLSGTRTGVYFGYRGDEPCDYKRLIEEVAPPNAAMALAGNINAVIPGRLAHLLNLKGPCVNIDTACSSSLVAMVMACQALRQHDVSTAVVGAVKVKLLPVDDSQGVGVESPSGRIRTFDAWSDGTGFGEGVVVLVLKRLRDALDAGDPVHAVVKGGSVNQDGRSIGLTAPNAEAQRDLLLAAWDDAGVEPESIGYIEAHGTGTRLGDPIELHGLQMAFSARTKRRQLCGIGSVKPNIGHLDSASGLAGVVKAIMCLQRRQIPASINFERPTDQFDFSRSALYVVDQLTDWDSANKRRCGVSSFGLSGTNAHLVLEEFIPDDPERTSPERGVLLLSANTEDDLRRMSRDWAERVLRAQSPLEVHDLAHTAALYRDRFPSYLTVEFSTGDELAAALLDWADQDSDSVPSGVFCHIDGRPEGGSSLSEGEQPVWLRSPGEIEAHYRNGNGRIVHAPGYPFATRRCWVTDLTDIAKEDVMVSSPDGSTSSTELAVGQCWAEVLNVRRLNVDDNFLTVGGDSISAVRLAASLRDALGVDVGVEWVLTHQTVRAQAAAVAGHTHADVPTHLIRNNSASDGWQPLTGAQRAMYLAGLGTESLGQNLPSMFRVAGELDEWRLEECLNEIVERHPSLRMRVEIRDGVPGWVPVPVARVLLGRTRAKGPEQAFRKLTVPFSLTKGPLFRAHIVETDSERFLYFDVHHIAADGTSLAIIVNELVSLYSGHALPPAPTLWTEVVDTIGKSADIKHWTRTLREELPEGRSAVSRFALHGDWSVLRHHTLDTDLSDRIRQAGRRIGVTSFTLMFAAFAATLHELLQEDTLVIGVPVAGRPAPGSEHRVGMFVNTLPIVTHRELNDTEESFVYRCAETLRSAFSHASAQQHEYASDLRAEGKELRIDALISYLHAPTESLRLGEAMLEKYCPAERPATYDIVLMVEEHTDHFQTFLEFVDHPALVTGAARIAAGMDAKLRALADDRSRLDVPNVIATGAADDGTNFVWVTPAEQDPVTPAGVGAIQPDLTSLPPHGWSGTGNEVTRTEVLLSETDSTALGRLTRAHGRLAHTVLLSAALVVEAQITGERRVNVASVLGVDPLSQAPDVRVVQSAVGSQTTAKEHLAAVRQRLSGGSRLTCAAARGLVVARADIDAADILALHPQTIVVQPDLRGERWGLAISHLSGAYPQPFARGLGLALQTALVNTGMDTETPVLSQALLDSTDWADTMAHGEQIPHDDVTVLDLIEQAIEEHRDDPALLAVDATLTYGELDAFAWGVCRALSDAGVKRGDVVAIAMDSSISAVVSVLGVLRAGAAYLSIGAMVPIERLRKMVHQANVTVALTDHDLPSEVVPVTLDVSRLGPASPPPAAPKPPSVEDVAYVMFTSGSTGDPKGVQVRHGGLTNYVLWRNRVHRITSADRHLQLISFSFDGYGSNLYSSLTTGGVLVLTDAADRLDYAAARALAVRHRITALACLPTMLQYLLAGAREGELDTVRLVVLAAERASTETLRCAEELLTGAAIVNEYGPTEATIGITANQHLTILDTSNVGHPADNSTVFVVSPGGQVLPRGLVGELLCAGPGVAEGYLMAPEATTSAFVSHAALSGRVCYRTGDRGWIDSDGQVHLSGRIDQQIKHNGVRLEIGEIESLAAAVPGVREAACVLTSPDTEKSFRSLVLYVVADRTVDGTELRAALAPHVLEAALPNRYQQLEDLPRTINGKVDRERLAHLKSVERVVLPGTVDEAAIHDAVAVLLGHPVSVEADLFEQGMTSVHVLGLVSALAGRYDLHPDDCYRFRTIRCLAASLSGRPSVRDQLLKLRLREQQPHEVRTSFAESSGAAPSSSAASEVGTALNYRQILVFGSTGYFGAHVVRQLLAQTDAALHLVVRAVSDAEARSRWEGVFHHYFGELTKHPGWAERVTTHAGDMTQAYFGLSRGAWDHLARSVDCIVNTAGLVSHYGDPADFEHANVASVQRMLDFARNSSRRIDLKQVSTLSVSGHATPETKNVVFDEDCLQVGQQVLSPYVKSKLRAERLLDAARCEVNVQIARLGNLVEDSCTGIFQANADQNAFRQLVTAMHRVGVFPDIPEELWDFSWVDLTADAFVRLMNRSGLVNNTVHLRNPHPVSPRAFFEKTVLDAEFLPVTEYLDRLISLLDAGDPEGLVTAIILHAEALAGGDPVPISATRTIDWLSAVGFEWPAVDTQYELLRPLWHQNYEEFHA